MLGFYNPSVILTYLSLISASLGFAFVLSDGEKGVFYSLICLMVSGVCDMFDGAVANLCHRSEEEKMFGIQIDALCDLVAFGALPAAITLRLGGVSGFSVVGATAILLSSVIRLGYFNVQETLRDKSEKRESYLGLPVTTVSILFPFLISVGKAFAIPLSVFAPASLCLLALLEVLKFSLKKPYGKAKLRLLLAGVLVFALLIAVRILKG